MSPARISPPTLRLVAAGVAVSLGVVAVASAGMTDATAATPNAQSVGRFLDGSLGGNPIEGTVNLEDATAQAAPNTSSRNPLTVDLLDKIKVPVGSALQQSSGGIASLGAANQIAVARTDGYSYGASGAVSNTGGAEVTSDKNAYPSDATLNLSGAALGSVSIPGAPAGTGLPTTGTSPAALGGVVASVGATQALAQTRTDGAIVTPQSSVAGLDLTLSSPALAKLISTIENGIANNPLANTLNGIIGSALSLPKSCTLSSTSTASVSLDSGAVVINASKGTITVDAAALLSRLLGYDITDLQVSNFDLTKFLVQNLPTILSKGVADIVTGITDALKTQFENCTTALKADPAFTALLTSLEGALNSGQTSLLGAISTVSAPLVSGSASGLTMLANELTNVADIGLNVQYGPKHQPREQTYSYSSKLAASADQSVAAVAGQSVVRAIEIDLLNTQTSLPAAAFRSGSTKHVVLTAAVTSYAVSLALGNAAAGPSDVAAAAASTSSTPSSSSSDLPDAIPAGVAGQHPGSPVLPLTVLAVALVIAGGSVAGYRLRVRSKH